MYAKSVDGLEISNRRFERTEAYQPWHRNRHALSFDGCRNVKVGGNKIIGKLVASDIHPERMSPSEATVAAGELLGK